MFESVEFSWGYVQQFFFFKLTISTFSINFFIHDKISINEGYLFEFERLWSQNKTYELELSFVSRQTIHQSHLRKSATCSSRNIFNVGVSLTPLKPEKQNEKLEVLTADDFNLRSIGSRWRRISGRTQTSLLTIYVEWTRTNINILIKDMFLTLRMSMN